MPDVYTQFRKAVESQGVVRSLLNLAPQLKPLPPHLEEGSIPNLEDFGMTRKALSASQHHLKCCHGCKRSLLCSIFFKRTCFPSFGMLEFLESSAVFESTKSENLFSEY